MATPLLHIIYLFPVLVLRAGFALIAPVPVHCFSITLNNTNPSQCDPKKLKNELLDLNILKFTQ